VNGGHSWSTIRNLHTIGALFEKQIHSVFPTDQIARKSHFAQPISHSFRRPSDVHRAVTALQDSDRVELNRFVVYNLNALGRYGTIDSDSITAPLAQRQPAAGPSSPAD
jgi:hypothetical protein